MGLSLLGEIDGIIARDPAARSRMEVALCYPSFHAVLAYRLAHRLWRWRWRMLARWVSQVARWITGIEIHPAAAIGPGLFIDHGMGVVIGETVSIGANVTLYHGVTLGGVSPSENVPAQRCVKRHPTLEDNVIVGAGAQVLGPVTVGRCARVGANAVVTRDVACCATVAGIPARVIARAPVREKTDFAPYGTPPGDLPDPVAQAVRGLLDRMDDLSARVRQLESAPSDGEAPSGKASAAVQDVKDVPRAGPPQ